MFDGLEPTLPLGAQRLLTLAAALEAMPPEKFSILKWSCGTTCCAVGLAGSLPEFLAQGFRLARMPDGTSYPEYKYYFGYGAAEKFFEIGVRTAARLFAPGAYGFVVDPVLSLRPPVAGEPAGTVYGTWPVSPPTPTDVAARIRAHVDQTNAVIPISATEMLYA